MIKDNSSADGQNPPRRKRFAPRTRTGCLTCRTRRIKCDEARPACQRCISAWRPCEGYHLPAVPATARTLAPADSRLQPTLVVPTAAERALGRYFITEIGAVAGDEFNTTFWSRDVPQVARAVPAVWHASNALAGATWARSPGGQLTVRAAALVEQESTRQYSAAVRHILQLTAQRAVLPSARSPSPHDRTAVLLATILLASYAMGIGERRVFASIVATSRRLVRQWAFWECLDVPSVAALAAQILYVYVKMERVAQDFHLEAAGGADEQAALARPPWRWLDALAALQRRPLTSALRACLELDMIWNSVHDILDALPCAPSDSDMAIALERRQPFARLFSSWEARYAAYTARLRRSGRRAPPLDVDIVALDLRRVLVRVLLRVVPSLASETCWDPFARDFAAAVACLEAALPAAAAAAAATNTVLSTPSIYASCNFIVHKCRAPGLRRRAAAVLRHSLVAALGRHAHNDDGLEQQPLIVDRLVLVEESAWAAAGECGGDDACVPGRAAGDYVSDGR
ncbi:Zn(II)2Cys6 transcription factor [Cordyceps militaris]|uniref:Zn(II)2Cys6 transcription factor n=1 Tax=Cordyceps militaris TaxID=73501 RepID=A0A2H4S877_CORMI|nr:Zn(II)2Cys6 transcription factor [Cordyceps militaris]